MQKRTQFISASGLAGVGIILAAVGRFSASADELIPRNLTFSIVMISGLVLMLAAALWFYFLSTRE